MIETSRQADKETRGQESNATLSLSPCLLVSLSIVVIGYGNDLRGDDAVGPLAAMEAAASDMPGVQALAVHQLMPELAETLATADLAIFVDARVPHPPFLQQDSGPGDEGEQFVSVYPIEPAARDSAIGHTGDPRALLALTKALYGRCPVAWSITVPASSFAFGEGLSPATERGLTVALQQIRNLVANAREDKNHA